MTADEIIEFMGSLPGWYILKRDIRRQCPTHHVIECPLTAAANHSLHPAVCFFTEDFPEAGKALRCTHTRSMELAQTADGIGRYFNPALRARMEAYIKP